MTVGELIEKLKHYPSTMDVYSEQGCADVLDAPQCQLQKSSRGEYLLL